MSTRTQGEDADWTAPDFARLLTRFEPHYPISDRYEVDHLPGEHWWTSQREHVVGWLNELDGPGAYDRMSRGLGARHFYQHFQCAPGLLWVAEALGEEPVTVELAAREAGGHGRPAAQCATIRRVIPWGRIAEMASSLDKSRVRSREGTAWSRLTGGVLRPAR